MLLRFRDGIVTPSGYVVFLIVECLVSSPLRKAVLAERVKSAAMTNTFSTGSAAARFVAAVALILFCAPHPILQQISLTDPDSWSRAGPLLRGSGFGNCVPLRPKAAGLHHFCKSFDAGKICLLDCTAGRDDASRKALSAPWWFCPPFKPASRRRRREVCSTKSLGQRLSISCGFQCPHRYSTGLSWGG
jgi:hypothetical protein